MTRKSVPAIYILDSIRIMVYFYDHNPPHFHAIYDDYEELIIIPSWKTLKGGIPKVKKRKLITWATENEKFIITKWNEFNPENKL